VKMTAEIKVSEGMDRQVHQFEKCPQIGGTIEPKAIKRACPSSNKMRIKKAKLGKQGRGDSTE
jgi:hypothetical protein